MAVSLVLVAGCGSSGSSNASNTTTTLAGSSTDATTGSGTASSTTAPSFVGSANSAYCNLARSVSLNPNFSDPKAAFQQFDSVSDKFVSTAPSAIKADAQNVVAALKMVETAFKNVNYDTTKIKASDLTPVQDPKFAESANRIGAYDSQVCGITTQSS